MMANPELEEQAIYLVNKYREEITVVKAEIWEGLKLLRKAELEARLKLENKKKEVDESSKKEVRPDLPGPEQLEEKELTRSEVWGYLKTLMIK